MINRQKFNMYLYLSMIKWLIIFLFIPVISYAQSPTPTAGCQRAPLSGQFVIKLAKQGACLNNVGCEPTNDGDNSVVVNAAPGALESDASDLYTVDTSGIISTPYIPIVNIHIVGRRVAFPQTGSDALRTYMYYNSAIITPSIEGNFPFAGPDAPQTFALTPSYQDFVHSWTYNPFISTPTSGIFLSWDWTSVHGIYIGPAILEPVGNSTGIINVTQTYLDICDATPSPVPTNTPTSPPSPTPTKTPTATVTRTITQTRTITPTGTITPTPTNTPIIACHVPGGNCKHATNGVCPAGSTPVPGGICQCPCP